MQYIVLLHLSKGVTSAKLISLFIDLAFSFDILKFIIENILIKIFNIEFICNLLRMFTLYQSGFWGFGV